MRPTVVRADPASRVCQEEVFGPFVTVTTFRSDEEAIAIANGRRVRPGRRALDARPVQRAHRVARAIRSGMVWINSYKRVNPGSPFGGTGPSGYGREMGFEAMHEYTEAKSVWVNVDADIPPLYPRPDVPMHEFTYDALPGRVIFGDGAFDRVPAELDHARCGAGPAHRRRP